MIRLILSLVLLYSLPSFSKDGKKSDSEYSLWEDTKSSFFLLIEGSYTQFKTRSNLYYLGASIPSLYWAFEEDVRIKDLTFSKDIKKPVEIVGELGVVMSFPVIPLSSWYIAKSQKNNHLRQFAIEYAATVYLALAESGLLSFIEVHERPTSQNISFWEEAFRGDSSWPSGHVIPYMALFYKTLQFYGPYWAIIPAALTYFGSLQRLQDGKHWTSDVVASFFLTAFAAEGVRAANKYKDNDPFYKWMFEHEVRLGVLRYERAWGPRVSLSF
ncbi:MAG: phosphatase PAP2 family protein [Bacteriovoracaceae bacterium]